MFDFPADQLAGYLHSSTHPAAELTTDDRAILRVLHDAPGSIVSGKDMAHALGLRGDWSALRKRLAPRAPLQRLGLVHHVEGEGYALTEAGSLLAAELR